MQSSETDESIISSSLSFSSDFLTGIFVTSPTDYLTGIFVTTGIAFVTTLASCSGKIKLTN